MQPRVAPGRVTAIRNAIGSVALDSGGATDVALRSDAGFRVGCRVLVTFGAKGEILRVGLDLAAIGMTELEAYDPVKLAARFDALIAQGPLATEQREAIAAMLEMHRRAPDQDTRRLCDRIERALRGDTLPLTAEDPWAVAAREDLASSPARDAWLGLLTLRGDGARPTKKWQVAAEAHVRSIGVPAFVEAVRRWFALVAPRRPVMADDNAAALKNLVWACGTIDEPQASERLAVAVGDLAMRCFTKIPGLGPLSNKVGNACIHVLSQLPGSRAVAQLSRIASRVRYRQALALVDKARAACAERAGMAPIDLEELSLPTFGLDVEGRARIPFGACEAELALVEDRATLTFFGGGRRLRSAPEGDAEELADLRAAHKELAALVPTVRARLERWMFEPRAWSLADLRTRYLDHPLVARLARRVIYLCGEATVIFFDGFPLDREGKEVALADDARLSLWHPLERPAEEIESWRRFLATLEVTQPFKQVDREVYRPPDAGARSSTRFAGHAVRQHQLAALMRERGWTYSLMGSFDRTSTPTKELPAYDLSVELAVDAPWGTPAADSGVYLQVTTGGVRFLRRGRAVALGEVPPRCYSETMRDVDLFVSARG